MSRGRSSHGGSSESEKAAKKYLKCLAVIAGAYEIEDQHMAPGFKDEVITRVRAYGATISKALDEYEQVVDVVNRADAAEQRLAGIGTSITAKEDHLARLLKKQDQVEAELATKSAELVTASAALERVQQVLAGYRARIAAI